MNTVKKKRKESDQAMTLLLPRERSGALTLVYSSIPIALLCDHEGRGVAAMAEGAADSDKH